MLQYTIEGRGCCGGLGQTVEASDCPAPTISFVEKSPRQAKQTGQQAWFETRGGMYMALPRTFCMAGWFKALQRAVNAYAERYPEVLDPIRVDARIGPETLAAVQQIAQNTGQQPPADVEALVLDYQGWLFRIAGFAQVPINADPEPKPGPHESREIVDKETAAKADLDTGGWWSRNWKWVALAAMGTGAAALTYSIYKKRREERGAGLLPAG